MQVGPLSPGGTNRPGRPDPASAPAPDDRDTPVTQRDVPADRGVEFAELTYASTRSRGLNRLGRLIDVRA
jgi:hypothetical protein